MHLRKFWLFAGAVIAALTLVATGSASHHSSKAGGVMVIGLEQEPTILNNNIIGGDALANTYAVAPIFSETYRIQPSFAFKPELISKAKVQQHPFRVTYYIKKNANWNDGGKLRPVTAQDYVFTWHLILNKSVQILSTTGYDQIKSAKVINSKTVRFTYSTPFAGYKLLFNGPLPSFALKGMDKAGNSDFNKTWLNFIDNPQTGKPISDGPFLQPSASSFVHGRQLTLARNPKWWNGKSNLNELIFRFFPDSQTTAQLEKSGELDVINPQPQVFLVPLTHQSGLRTQIGRGPVFEHIDFNVGFGSSPNPLLAKKFARQAFGYAIDRTALVKALFKSTGIAPSLPVLNDIWIFKGSPFYKSQWGYLNHNAAKAISIMKANGCTGGPSRPGAGGTWTCQGTKAAFKFAWRSGNQLRQLTFEVLQQQLKEAGIEIKADDSANLFSSRLPKGDYEVTLFAWQGSPDLSGLDNLYSCRDNVKNTAQQNTQGYCNTRVTRDLAKVNNTFDTKTQARIFNDATSQMAQDVITIPLYQKPTYLIYKSRFRGLVENPTTETFEWNIGRVKG